MSCIYEIPWYGICQKDTKGGNMYCEKHLNRTCVVCGNQAVTECGFASSLTCGAPLCDNKECHKKHIASHSIVTSKEGVGAGGLIREMLKPENKQEIISRYNEKFKGGEIEFQFYINPDKEEGVHEECQD